MPYHNHHQAVRLAARAERGNVAHRASKGATGPVLRRGNRWFYPEYNPDQAMASINEGRDNVGTRMKMTISMAILFRHAVFDLDRSPNDARMMIIEALPGREVPYLKTFYNHIEAGDRGVWHGDTTYHLRHIT